MDKVGGEGCPRGAGGCPVGLVDSWGVGYASIAEHCASKSEFACSGAVECSPVYARQTPSCVCQRPGECTRAVARPLTQPARQEYHGCVARQKPASSAPVCAYQNQHRHAGVYVFDNGVLPDNDEWTSIPC